MIHTLSPLTRLFVSSNYDREEIVAEDSPEFDDESRSLILMARLMYMVRSLCCDVDKGERCDSSQLPRIR